MRRVTGGLAVLGLALVVLGVVMVTWLTTSELALGYSQHSSGPSVPFTVVTRLEGAGYVGVAAGTAVLTAAVGLAVGLRHGRRTQA